MWKARVPLLIEREQVVDAPAETVWELISSPAALSACPPWFAFSVPAAVPGTDRLCCVLTAREGSAVRPTWDARTAACHVLDVRQEIPGQGITWQVLSMAPAGEQFVTLSVRPRGRRSAIRIALYQGSRRLKAPAGGPDWPRGVKAWLERLRATAEGREPWPPAELPAASQQALAAPPPLRNPLEVSVTVAVTAAPGAVWDVITAPVTSSRTGRENIVWSGPVPGTPLRGIGGVACNVHRIPDGRFTAAAYLTTEWTDGQHATARRIGEPLETSDLITEVPGGSELEMTIRWRARGLRDRADLADAQEKMRAGLLEIAESYRELIEADADDRVPDQTSGGHRS